MSTSYDDVVLARLPNGARIVSSLLDLDQPPPRHLYRVVNADGTVRSEHTTLVALFTSLQDRPPLRAGTVAHHG